MSQQAKFDYVVKKSSFKQTKLMEYIHSQDNVNHINDYVGRFEVNSSFDLLLSIQSMEGMTLELIDKIDKKFQYFQIKSWQHSVSDDIRRKNDLSDGNGGIFESREDYCESCCIYTREELKQIITKIEQIEKGTENLDDFAKLLTIYDRLKRNISYDYELNDKASLYTRSLRGLLTGKTVCAGYATILQHILQRQGVVCKFVEGLTSGGEGHAWNVVELNGKQYGLDLTWDACNYHNGRHGINSMKYFGKDVTNFNASHKAMNNIGASNYSQLSDFEKDGYNVNDALGLSILNQQFQFGQNCYKLNRKDGTTFYIAEIGTMEIVNPSNNKPVTVYKYVYIPYANNRLDINKAKILHSGTSISTLRDKVDRVTNLEKDQNQRSEYMSIVQSFINNIMSEENIDKAIKQGSSFVGTSFLDKDSKRATFTNPSVVQNLNIFNIQNLRIVDNFIVNKTQNNNLYKFTYYAVNGENGSMSAKSVYS